MVTPRAVESESPTDSQLIEQVRGGDLNAFSQLIVRYQDRVFRIQFQFLQDYQLAEDLTQETFVRVHANLTRYDATKGAFSTWLYTIARNLARNALAKRAREKGTETLVEVATPEGESPRGMASRKDVIAQLDAALQGLPELYQTAFILAEIEELPLSQVAEIEGVPLGTIKSRVSRAKEKLREALQKQDHEP